MKTRHAYPFVAFVNTRRTACDIYRHGIPAPLWQIVLPPGPFVNLATVVDTAGALHPVVCIGYDRACIPELGVAFNTAALPLDYDWHDILTVLTPRNLSPYRWNECIFSPPSRIEDRVYRAHADLHDISLLRHRHARPMGPGAARSSAGGMGPLLPAVSHTADP
jgi:hypothetical protein